MDELNTELSVLQSHLDGLLGCVRENDINSRRFQKLEMHLLSLSTLVELIEHVLDDTKKVFDLKCVTFVLVDERNERSQFLKDEGLSPKMANQLILHEDDELLKKSFGKAVRPYLGRYQEERCGPFFGDLEKCPTSVALLPLLRRGHFLGSLNLGSSDSQRFNNQLATDFLDRLSCILSVCLENTLNFELLRRTSLIDALTGVNNRRFFDQRIGEEMDRVQRSGENLSCLFLDIDHFKSINDTYGHLMGDLVLAEVARGIRSQLRNNDVLARYGGEEFVALLSGASVKKAVEAGERIRRKIENQTVDTPDEKKVKVTISVGVATFNPEESLEEGKIDGSKLIEWADNALYDAKSRGRNLVVSCGVICRSAAISNIRVSPG